VALRIPQVTSSSQVTIITNTTTCAQARTALAATLDNPVAASDLSVILLQVDTVYVVSDPTQRAGDYSLAAVYGAAFQPLDKFGY
jgi:hypothetical protein